MDKRVMSCDKLTLLKNSTIKGFNVKWFYMLLYSIVLRTVSLSPLEIVF